MSLSDDYLQYPKRRYGMDQDLYAWRPVGNRKALALPGAKILGVALIVPIEHHGLNPSGKPFKHPGAMVTPYPDLRHYTTRDYGNRVGVFRILDALANVGLNATFPVNAQALDRLAPLVDAITTAGHELAAYGLSTDHIHFGGLPVETEAQWVDEVKALFKGAGHDPQVWMSPARQQSFSTLRLLAKAGFRTCLDWEMDEVPVAVSTDAGPITCLPLSNELDDRLLLIDRRQSEEDWLAQILAAIDCLCEEPDRFGARTLAITLTPYVIGQPFRIKALRALCARLASDPRLVCAGVSDLTAAYCDASQSSTS
jgi:peptidoglycan/xylan/chitin deacetylase (PgdA/CDA1 family)